MHRPVDVRKLLTWLKGGPVLEANIVAAGFNRTLDKALMQNLVEMNVPEATASITARGLAALKTLPPQAAENGGCCRDATGAACGGINGHVPPTAASRSRAPSTWKTER